MRQLTVKQKKILDKVFNEDNEISCVNDLPFDVWEKLENINDTEILYQEVNRYLSDKYFNKE